MKLLKALLSLLVTLGLVYVLNTPWGTIPALGPFLSPFTGFWQNGESASDRSVDLSVAADSLQNDVTIRFDDNGIPHIFAKNNYDLYFAQGFVTARDRLWQMDLQTRAAAGRLSEVLGPATLALDQKSRRLGMGYGAEANFKVAMSNPTSREALLAYTAGVNAYISQLAYKDYPVEFKLLGYAPEPWEPIKTMYMLEQMMLTLAGRADDLSMTNILKKYGQEVVNELFPNYPRFRESPIIPEGTPWNFTPLPLPSPSNLTTLPLDEVKADSAASDTLLTMAGRRLPVSEPAHEGVGSNNWAVGGAKSLTGYPILANDPHLELTLPSIWYQVQLSGPESNVCGVSLPGIPAVIIGFNQSVAWGVTNVDADVMDLYEVTFKDATRSAYLYNNRWQPIRKRVEVIKVKGLPEVRDTVVYTHHGPVAYYKDRDHKGADLAIKWIGHEPGGSFLTFYELNKARNYDDYRSALAHYHGPAQNFVFADNANTIAMTVNGRFPLKWKEQGKFVLDGSNPSHDWQGWIPAEQNPHVRNPERGFVSSANQSSTDPSYPYYINWRFAPSERGVRINERLAVMTQANADSLRMLQNDNFSVLARTILPTLLEQLAALPLSPTHKAAYQLLADWNWQNDAESIAASIFERWYPTLGLAIWEDEFGGDSLPMIFPSRDQTIHLLLRQPEARWFDDLRTPQKETLSDVVFRSFKSSLDTLTAHHGPMGPAWRWASVRGTEVRHLSRLLKPFNSGVLQVGGGGTIVNAITKTNGPSWRMVVELSDKMPKAYGIYPGGQSGNPGSPLYTNMLAKWEKGELDPLVYLQAENESNERLVYTLTLKKK